MTAPLHLRLAQALLPHIGKDNTSYIHTEPPVVRWGEGSWRSDADCSNFVNALLGETYGWATAGALNDWFRVGPSEHPRHPRPLAGDYYRAISGQLSSCQGLGFAIVGVIGDVVEGDIIAIDYSKNPDAEHDTGHVMLVESVSLAPPDQQAEAQDGTTQWLARVIDQSDATHGPGDTRYDPHDPHRRKFKGLGSGVVRFYVDPSGAIKAYAWVGNHLEPSVTWDRPAVIGRLVDRQPQPA
jgi:hypothetical protein